MTPQELHTALDTHRKTRRWPWWRVAARLDISKSTLDHMKNGHLTAELRARVEAWLGEAT